MKGKILTNHDSGPAFLKTGITVVELAVLAGGKALWTS